MFSEGGCGIWGDKCYESVSFGEVCDKLKGLACAFKEKKLGFSDFGPVEICSFYRSPLVNLQVVIQGSMMWRGAQLGDIPKDQSQLQSYCSSILTWGASH